jgi:hypothetical protein
VMKDECCLAAFAGIMLARSKTMSVTKVTIDLVVESGNAGLVDDPKSAIVRILTDCVEKVKGLAEGESRGFNVYDINGNDVGTFHVGMTTRS